MKSHVFGKIVLMGLLAVSPFTFAADIMEISPLAEPVVLTLFGLTLLFIGAKSHTETN